MKFKKKAEEMDTLVVIILGLVLIIGLSFLAYKFFTSQAEKLRTDSCKDSIAAHSFMATATAGDVFTKIKCPTTYLTLNPNNATKTKKAIAEDMHKCWYEWGLGQGRYFKGDGTFCYVCGVYDFTEKDKKVNGMALFLATEPIKVKYAGDKPGYSYMNYFQGYTSTDSPKIIKDAKIQNLSNLDYLDSSQKYASVFVYISGKEQIAKTLEGYKIATAAGGMNLIALGVAGTAAGTIGFATSAFGAVATVGAVNAWNPVGWVILTGVGVIAAAGGVFAVYEAYAAAKSVPEYMSFIVLRPYNAESLKALNCQEMAVYQQSHSTP